MLATALLLVSVLSAQAATLTELDRTQIALLNALAQLRDCRAQLTADQVQRQLQDTKAAIERRHPGFTWDPATGALTRRP